jgi:hypothetical protein
MRAHTNRATEYGDDQKESCKPFPHCSENYIE